MSGAPRRASGAPRLKVGTRVETRGTPAMGAFPAVAPETARISPVRRKARANARTGGEGVPGSGWYIVRFDSDGGRLCMHESRFRVISNGG